MTEQRITAHTMQRRFGEVRRTVMRQGPVIVTHHGTDDMVILSAEQYAELQRYRPAPMYAHEMPGDLVAELEVALAPTDAARFDDEADDAA